MTRTLSYRVVLAGLLLMLAALAFAGPAAAVQPGRNGRIAFTSGREGADDSHAQIYLRGAAGSTGFGTLTPLNPSPLTGQSRHPSWSPDRTKIVFANGTFTGDPKTEEYDILIKDLTTGSVTALDPTQVGDGLSSDHPSWSPDGTRIAYETQKTDNDANREIMVKTVGSTLPAVALTADAQQELKAAWSPDSSTLYYAKQNGTAPASNFDIVKQPATGGVETPVADSTLVDEYQPAISPDGAKLCFTLQST